MTTERQAQIDVSIGIHTQDAIAGLNALIDNVTSAETAKGWHRRSRTSCGRNSGHGRSPLMSLENTEKPGFPGLVGLDIGLPHQ